MRTLRRIWTALPSWGDLFWIAAAALLATMLTTGCAGELSYSSKPSADGKLPDAAVAAEAAQRLFSELNTWSARDRRRLELLAEGRLRLLEADRQTARELLVSIINEDKSVVARGEWLARLAELNAESEKWNDLLAAAKCLQGDDLPREGSAPAAPTADPPL